MNKCSECGKDINDKDKKCPHCGVKIKKIKSAKKNNTKIKIIVGIVLGVILLLGVGLVYFHFNSSKHDTVIQSNARDNTVKQIKVITDYINIRESENVSSKILGKVYKGEIYTVLGENSESPYRWIYIETANGTKGYISGKEEYVSVLSGKYDNNSTSDNISDNANNTDNSSDDNNGNTNVSNNNADNNANTGNNTGANNQGNNTNTSAKKIKSVVLTPANWRNYYDVIVTPRWDDPVLNVYGSYVRNVDLRLKNAYYDKTLLREHPEYQKRIELEIKFKCYSATYEFDWVNKTYKEINSHGTTSKTVSTSALYDTSYPAGYWYSNVAFNSNRLEKSEDGYEYCDIEDVTRIVGTIYYYE